MSSKVQQSVCSDCVTYAKSRIKFNTLNAFNNVNNNKSNENETTYKVSKTTADMLNILREFVSWQDKAISLFEGREQGDEVIEATVATFDSIRGTIAANVEQNLCNLQSGRI